jgi:hypothetical protein
MNKVSFFLSYEKRENHKIFELQTPHAPEPAARGGGVLREQKFP